MSTMSLASVFHRPPNSLLRFERPRTNSVQNGHPKQWVSTRPVGLGTSGRLVLTVLIFNHLNSYIKSLTLCDDIPFACLSGIEVPAPKRG